MTNERGAGILLAITSLPSAYGVGDLGPCAREFADQLGVAKQKYWQVLPVNPISATNGYSPYSSISGMAGNTLLISPDELVREGLLTAADIKDHQQASTAKADYATAEQIKDRLSDIAFQHFLDNEYERPDETFNSFCERESYWLDDFAWFSVLKDQHDGHAWYQWPILYKNRDTATLQLFEESNRKAIKKVKWLQYIFFQQWYGLKQYCNSHGVQLFGDLPFYVSYDSADVWANRQFFALDETGEILGVAGVPPDYFSEDGQLWGMPVYNWDRLKDTGYAWWVQRLRKNMELFDVLRLDHFRAFDEYWEIEAGATSAKAGKWMPGPGADLFKAIKDEIGGLPFVAEDLGDKMRSVFEFRDKLGLPGMKILLFAFGDDVGGCVYAPHNFPANCICYTGTHDNNTAVGWYRQDADERTKNSLNEYTGSTVDETNVHIVLTRLAYASVANTVIVPMQDILGLDEQDRMNTPATIINNWEWRMTRGQMTNDIATQLATWVDLYGR